MATTASGFWYPDEGTAFNINTIMSTAMSSVETKAGPHVLDTGWVDCALRSGVSQQGGSLPQVRRIGKLVYMRWGVSGSGFTTNISKDSITIPSGFRPTSSKYFPIATNNANIPGVLVINPTGIGQIRTGSSVGTYYIFDTAWWAID